MKKITVVILHFRDRANTDDCIRSFCSAVAPVDTLVDILVVDNGNKEKYTLPHVEYTLGDLLLIRNEENKGYAGGMNTGIKHAIEHNADYVMVLNNDTVIESSFLPEMKAAIDFRKHTGIVVPKIFFLKGTEFHKDRYKKDELGKVIWFAGGETDWKNIIAYHIGVDEVDHGQYDHIQKTNLATGCCILIKREVFEKVGLFDETYFLYYEDNDFSQKILRAGFEIGFAPKAILWHKNAKAAGGAGSVLQDYYISRNRMLFGMRYAPLRAKFALFRESIRLLRNGREWQKKGIRDYYLRRFGKGSFPL